MKLLKSVVSKIRGRDGAYIGTYISAYLNSAEHNANIIACIRDI